MDQDVVHNEFTIKSHWSQSMLAGLIHCCGSIYRTRLGKLTLSEVKARPLLRLPGWLIGSGWTFDLGPCETVVHGLLFGLPDTRPEALIHLPDLQNFSSVPTEEYMTWNRRLTASGQELLQSGCTVDSAPLTPRAEHGTRAAAAPHLRYGVLGAP